MSHLQQGLSARPHNPIITMTLKEQINTERIPAHVAIIMDGNGRWAKATKKAWKPCAKSQRLPPTSVCVS